MKLKSTFIEIAWRVLFIIFLFTAVSKLIDFKVFAAEISNQPFDKTFTPLLIYGLPAMEIVLCLLLFFKQYRYWGFLLSAVVMFFFTGYVALVTLNYYDRVPCSCAGVFEQMSWPQHLILNLFLLVLAVLGTWFLKRNNASPPAEPNYTEIMA